MCGICGVYSFSGGKPTQNMIDAMNQRMLHRGPDDGGSYFHGPVGLGMRRLSIIDTQSGHQPIPNETQTIWVVLNGEIYNYIELREELEAKGHRFSTQTDTEVLVHLYEEDGLAAIDKLNGMFAFALYDQTKQALWIARDRLGIKPLYVAHQRNQFFFSSDLTAINAVLHTQTLNADAFLSYMAFAHVSDHHTMYQNIDKLQPGHWMWIDGQGIKTHAYWALTQTQTWHGSVEQAEHQLFTLLDDAVRLQVRSDVPVGIALSGGVDSSAITAFAKRHHQDLTTLTIDFVGKQSEDTVVARNLATSWATRHLEIPFFAHEISNYLAKLIPLMDEPIADSAIIASYLVAQGASQAGIKVLLNGAGGDEIFGGYRRHHPPTLGSTAWLATIPKPLHHVVSPVMHMLNKDKGLRMQDVRIAYGTGYTGTNLALFSELFQEHAQFKQLIEVYLQQCHAIVAHPLGDVYSKMMLDLKHYLVGNILALTDKASMACSVEARVPLLDHRLVEYAFSLPTEMNIFNRQAKGLFRHLLKPMLPKHVLTRAKEGFSAPIPLWTKDAFGQEIARELLSDTIALYRDIFQVNTLRKWVTLANQGHSAATTVYRLYIFSLWYRCHIEGKR